MIDPVMVMSKVIVRSWARELAATFQTNTKSIVCGGISLLVMAFAFGGLMALTAVSNLNVDIPEELRLTIYRTSLGGCVITAGVIATLLCVTTPSRTSFHTLVDLLPISRVRAHLGMRLPLLVAGLIFALPLSATSALVIIRFATGWIYTAISLAILAIALTITLTTVIGLFTLLHFVMHHHCKLPYNYASAATGIIMLAITISSAASDILALGPDRDTTFVLNDILLHRVAASTLMDPLAIGNMIGIAVWGLIAGLLFVSSGSVYSQSISQRPPIILQGINPGLSSKSGSIWFSMLAAVRSTQFITSLLLPIPLLALTGFLKDNPLLKEVAIQLSPLIPSIPAYLSIYAVGRMLRLRWIATTVKASNRWWIWPTIAVYLSISVVVATIFIAAELVIGLTDFSDIHSLYSRVVLTAACALLGGALVPYSEEQPLTTTAAGLATLVLFMASSLLVSFIASVASAEVVITVVRFLIALMLIMIVALVCQRIESQVRRE